MICFYIYTQVSKALVVKPPLKPHRQQLVTDYQDHRVILDLWDTLVVQVLQDYKDVKARESNILYLFENYHIFWIKSF